MDLDVTLFLLRLVSATLLLAILAALFVVMWKEYKGITRQIEANRRSYGKLTVIQMIDNSFVLTGDVFPLLVMTSLGRSPTNNVIIEDTFASSEHAVIALRDGQWWLEDRNSKNGTTLNDVDINQAIVITNGDMIGIGERRYRLDLE